MDEDLEILLAECETQLDGIEERLKYEEVAHGLNVIARKLTDVGQALDKMKPLLRNESLRERRAQASSRCEDLGVDLHNSMVELESDWSEFNDRSHPPMPQNGTQTVRTIPAPEEVR